MKRSALLCLVLLASAASTHAADIDLRTLSFNIWQSDTGGAASRENIVQAIRASGANLVALQEANHLADAERIRASLGSEWRLHHRGGQGYLSTFPILGVSPGGHGVLLELSPGHPLWLFNAHLSHAPYGPYQLAGIAYYGGPLRDPRTSSGVSAVIADQAGRVREAQQVLQDIQRSGALAAPAVVLAGDFNEPSPLDWTPRARAAGRVSAVVSWPTHQVFLGAGLRDAWRSVFTDEVANAGPTWSPHYGPDYRESHYPHGVYEPQDRIDLIFFSGHRLQITDAMLLGPVGDTQSRLQYGQGSGHSRAGEFPSDHRGVLARFQYRTGNETVLTFSGLPHNPGNANALNAGYGDYTPATPDLSVRFLGSNGAYWDTYDSRQDGLELDANWRGGVAQLQNGGPGRVHELEVAARNGARVSLPSFRLLDYQNWASGHGLRWSLRNERGNWLAGGTVNLPQDGVLTVQTGVSRPELGLRLSIEHLQGDVTDLAIDDIRLQQH